MSIAKQYRKKPVVIEAMKFTGSVASAKAIGDWTLPIPIGYGSLPRTIRIPTLEGLMTAQAGDYIIKGITGEFYPCKPDIFLQSYEQVSDLLTEDSNANKDAADAPRGTIRDILEAYYPEYTLITAPINPPHVLGVVMNDINHSGTSGKSRSKGIIKICLSGLKISSSIQSLIDTDLSYVVASRRLTI